MKYNEACHKNKLGVSQRKVDDLKVELYDLDSDSFFYGTHAKGGYMQSVDRKPGAGTKTAEDWEACTHTSTRAHIERWKADKEDRPLKPKLPWQRACENSPVKRAIRFQMGGLAFIRCEDKTTYEYNRHTDTWTLKVGPFCHFDGWKPLADVGPYATFAPTEEKPVRGYNPEEATLVLETPEESGSSQDESIPRREIDQKVLQGSLEMAGLLVRSLEFVKEPVAQGRIVEALTRIAKNYGWLLREDRDHWY